MARKGKITSSTSKDGKSTRVTGKTVRVARVNPERIFPLHSNDIIIAHTENEFFITFSQMEPYLFLDSKELEKLDSIDAIARAKVVLTPEMAEKLLNALTTNIETYKKGKKKEDAKKA